MGTRAIRLGVAARSGLAANSAASTDGAPGFKDGKPVDWEQQDLRGAAQEVVLGILRNGGPDPTTVHTQLGRVGARRECEALSVFERPTCWLQYVLAQLVVYFRVVFHPWRG